MINFKLHDNAMRRLQKTLEDTPKEIPKRVASAINKTSKKHLNQISKKLREYVKVSAKGSKRSLSINRKAKAPYRLRGGVRVKKLYRPSLKYFGARQTKKGVNYQIDKGEKRFIKGAFGPKIDKLNNNVFVRKNPYVKNPKHKPSIRKANRELSPVFRGARMFDVYRRHRLERWSRKMVRKELTFQIDQQIKYVLFKRGK